MKYLLLLISISLLTTSCKTISQKNSVVKSEGWFNIAVTNDEEIYIDTTSIRHEGAFSYAKEKRIYITPEGRKSYVDKIRAKYTEMKMPEKADKWNDFSYCIYQCEYDCLNKRFRNIWIDDFDSTGKRIARTPSPKKNIRWMNVNTETVGDYTFFFVCDYQ
ncbi:MAG: surface-adhesin E family protein [Dysgonomonas sp.]